MSDYGGFLQGSSAVDFFLGGCKISEGAIEDCLRLVQSYVSIPGFCPQSFFTESTLGAVRSTIDSAGIFVVTPAYDVWKDDCDSGVDSFVVQCRTSYDEYLSKRRKSYEQHYVDYNRMNRLSRVSAVVPAADSSSTTSSGSKGSRGYV